MPRVTTADLERRIAELEAENQVLRSTPGAKATPASASGNAPARSARSWPWTLLSTVLVLIGVILAPVSVVASWANITLTDTDRFVSSYAPLADDPSVQGFVTDQTVGVINQQIDIPQLTSEVIDGITDLGTGPVATNALNAMKGPAAAGVQSLIESTVGNFVASDTFSTVWREALRISHGQLVAAMQNDPNSAVQIAGNGSIGIQLSPIIDAVKVQLLANGLDFAKQIPSVDRTIVIAQSDAVPTVQMAYGLAVAAGAWLPYISLLFLLAGVLVARRKSVALIWAAVGLALSMVAVLAGIGIGKVVLIATVSPSLLPGDVTAVAYSTVVSAMQSFSVALLVLAISVAIVAWFAGPFSSSRRLRSLFASGAASARAAAGRHNVSTGRVGEWMYRQRVLVRVAIAIAAAAVILLVRPLTASLIIWTLVIAVLVLVITELVQRPVAEQLDAEAEQEPLVESVS